MAMKNIYLPALLILIVAVELSVQGPQCTCFRNKVCECVTELRHELKEGTFYMKLKGVLQVTLTYVNSNMLVAVGWERRALTSDTLTMPYERKPVCAQINTSQRPRVELCVFLANIRNIPKHTPPYNRMSQLILGDLYYYITYGERKIVPDTRVGDLHIAK